MDREIILSVIIFICALTGGLLTGYGYSVSDFGNCIDEMGDFPVIDKVETQAPTINLSLKSSSVKTEAVQVKINKTSEIQSIPEITTAEDIGLQFVQLRYEKPFLYLTALTDIKDKSPIFMETIENNEIREINLGRFGIMPQSTGKIDIKHPVTIRENCRIRLNFYRQGEKIATVSTPPVIDGKAIFVPVLLTTEKAPSQWQIRISSQSYDSGKLTLRGETNIPNEKLIAVSIDSIGQWQDSRVEKFSTTPNSNSGLINFERGLILPQGRYKITASYEDRDYVLGMGVTKDDNGMRATDWIKNVYVPA